MSSWLKEKLWRSVTLGWLETSCMIPTMSPRAVYVLNLWSSALTEMKIVSFECYFMFLPFSVGHSNWPLGCMLLRTIYLQIINSCNFSNSVLKWKNTHSVLHSLTFLSGRFCDRINYQGTVKQWHNRPSSAVPDFASYLQSFTTWSFASNEMNTPMV